MPPLPAATLALLRQGEAGLEILLLKRSKSTGFIPGAYVFPGGRVDREDGADDVMRRFGGLEPEVLEGRLGASKPYQPPAMAFLVAAIRETFEETGVLIGKRDSTAYGALRKDLMAGRKTFSDVLTEVDHPIRAGEIEYIGHWITPEPEARRYDTRFFAVEVPANTSVEIDNREMAKALWLSPGEALERNQAGTLPLVFPTLVTLRELAGFGYPGEALAAYRERPIPRCLPTLTETPEGVRIDLVPEFG